MKILMWLSLGLSCLPCSASWINGFMSLEKFGKFSTRFLQVLFQPHLLSPFDWDSDDINIWFFVIIPWVPEALIIFFSFSLCFLDLVISVVFQFADTLIPTFCCWFYPLNFSFQLLSISVLKFLPFFFFIVFIFLGLYTSFLRLSIFTFVSILLVFIHWSILSLLL